MGENEVPTARLRALVRLLYPEHMTPIAKRQLDLLCDEYDRVPVVEVSGNG